MKADDQSLFELLRGSALVCETDEKLLSNFANKWKCSVFEALLETKLLSETIMAEKLSAAYGLPQFKIEMLGIVPLEVYQCVGFDFSQANLILPIAITDQGRLRILVANPADRETLTLAVQKISLAPDFVVGEAREILALVNERFPVELQVSFIISCRKEESEYVAPA